MIHLSCWDQHLPDKGYGTFQMIELHLVVDRQHDWIVIVFQIFNSIAELGTANPSNWSQKLTSLGVGLLLDIFRISDFFLKITGWDYNQAWDYTWLTRVPN